MLKVGGILMKKLDPKKIIEARKKKKLSRLDLAYLAGTSVTTIYNYETGKTPDNNIIPRIASVCEVAIDSLYCEESK